MIFLKVRLHIEKTHVRKKLICVGKCFKVIYGTFIYGGTNRISMYDY